ncbi:MAG: Asp-tRNA(Asn)/Glu-tRNA(Gln) amidotransferase subunit GatC [Pseudomonadota bacterium]|mgnify:CR=1 FL=1|nr:Asp-tRNA(Asn)/Glu-tRNA(Gln) amidotransferase subunit GatC [Pseudomonadota bacterium]
MHIEANDLDRLARLARLALTADERSALVSSLDDALSMVSALREVDVNGITPMAHPHDATLRLRADEVTETDRQSALERIAPQMQGGLYLVPKVIE